MKRSRASITAGRRKKAGKKSRYADKVARGQMYGPGCCAHTRCGGVNHRLPPRHEEST